MVTARIMIGLHEYMNVTAWTVKPCQAEYLFVLHSSPIFILLTGSIPAVSIHFKSDWKTLRILIRWLQCFPKKKKDQSGFSRIRVKKLLKCFAYWMEYCTFLISLLMYVFFFLSVNLNKIRTVYACMDHKFVVVFFAHVLTLILPILFLENVICLLRLLHRFRYTSYYFYH